MKVRRSVSTVLISAALAVGTALSGVGVASAQPPFQDRNHERDRGHERERSHQRERNRRDYILHRGRGYEVRPGHVRHYRNVIILRPYGHHYPGYGHYRTDASAYKWLAFTAITLAILNNMNESQQRAYEQAQIRATTAPIGERIIWRDGSASGAVTAVREGTSTSGRYCREFQQNVSIGGRTEQAYGTACRKPDGSWEVISTGSEP